ncbi:MAG: endolytic transglycosylase MltG, partial [Candidatus Paceibacterota bacterium]
MKRIAKIIILFVLLLFVFDFPLFNKYEDDAFQIKRGENVFQVSANLKNKGHIKSKILFLIESLRNKNYSKLKAGNYSLGENISNEEIIDIFVQGKKQVKVVTIIPGYTLKDISRLTEDRENFLNKYLYLEEDTLLKEKYSFLEDKPMGAGLEGYLYPDSYEIENDEMIVFQALDNFEKKLTNDLREEIEKQGKTIFEVIVMASLIEKEVILYEDKEIVSGILWKRLRSGMLLEVDSTELYFEQGILYNTYEISGLPKGPICNPEMESIRASIYPKETDFWFYLSDKNGKTIFSKNFNEHLIN